MWAWFAAGGCGGGMRRGMSVVFGGGGKQRTSLWMLPAVVRVPYLKSEKKYERVASAEWRAVWGGK